MECSAKALAAINPPMNPPPGSLWPRSRMKKENSSIRLSRSRVAVLRIRLSIMAGPPVSASVTSGGSRLGLAFSSAKAPRPAVATTRISPSVSIARKSTRITLTTFRPKPSV